MGLAPFFERIYGSIGGRLGVSRESLNTVLRDVLVVVRCGSSLSPNDAWISELCVNLLARIYPRLAISADSRRCARLMKLARDINPDIEFALPGSGASETVIAIGLPQEKDGAICPHSSGWVARVHHSPFDRAGPKNPYAAGAAACLACAEVFRRVFLKAPPEPDVSISLLNFDRDTGALLKLSAVDLGKLAIVGIGAVGNGALWALSRHHRVSGQMSLIDEEDIELSNLQRYALATPTDIGQAKVEIGKKALSSTDLTVEALRTTLEKFADHPDTKQLHTIVVSVDNIAGRRTAQALLPRLVINGWTGDEALGASWHLFSREAACLACLYHPHRQGTSATEQAARALGLSPERAAQLWVTRQPLNIHDIESAADALGVDERVLRDWRGKPIGELYTDVVCGAVPIGISGIGRVETVPLAHQSTLAGILMASELIKRSDPKLSPRAQEEALVSWDNILKVAPKIWTKPRPRETGCICTDKDYQKVYRLKWFIDCQDPGHHD